MADPDDGRDPFEYDLEEVTEGGDDATDGDRPEATAESGETWRFSLEEVNEEGIVRSRIEAGDPEPEHVLFVVLGAVATLLVFVRLYLLVA